LAQAYTTRNTTYRLCQPVLASVMTLAVFAALALLARSAIADRGNVALEVGAGTHMSEARSHKAHEISEMKNRIRELREQVDRLEAAQAGEAAVALQGTLAGGLAGAVRSEAMEELHADLSANLSANTGSCEAFEADSRHCCLQEDKCECTHTFTRTERFEFEAKTNLGYKEEKKSSHSNVGYKAVQYTHACSDAMGDCPCVTPQYKQTNFVGKFAARKSPCKRGKTTQCSEWEAPLY